MEENYDRNKFKGTVSRDFFISDSLKIEKTLYG